MLLASVALSAQLTHLDFFDGRNLWKERPTENEQALLDRYTGPVPKGFLDRPRPWRVWKRTRNGKARFVMLLGESLFIIPGGSSACIQVFDETATRLGSWSFQAGWRIELTDASIEYSPRLASDVVILHTSAVINGRDVAKQYYAVREDRLSLVRLEDAAGKATNNEYRYPSAEIGQFPDAKTVEAWLALLQSKDPVDVLAALIFLGGKHRPRSVGEPTSAHAELYLRLISSEPIRRQITQLQSASDEWIARSAQLAVGEIAQALR